MSGPGGDAPRWAVDQLTGTRTSVAPSRAARPHDADEPPPPCPFCPGAEDATPPELARVGDGPTGWRARAFPNRYPAVDADAPRSDTPTHGAPVSGAHEVVVTSPRHDARWATLGGDATVGLGLLLDRAEHHRAAGRASVEAFVNQGPAAGASLGHPHGQLLALDVAAPYTAREELVLAEPGCALCRVDPELVVGATGGWRAAALAGRSRPGEVLVARPEHGAPLRADVAGVVAGVTDVVRRVEARHGPDVALNLLFHDTTGHPHVHVVPRTATEGGFELGSGLRISSTTPAQDVAALREAL